MIRDLNKLENLYRIWYDSEEDDIDEICTKMYDLNNDIGRYYSDKMINARYTVEKYRIASDWFIELKATIKSKIANNLEVLEQISNIMDLKI